MRSQRLLAATIAAAAAATFAVTLTGAAGPASAAQDPVLYLASGANAVSGSAIKRYDLATHTTSVVLPQSAGRLYRHPVLSPDGRQLVVERSYADTAGTDLVVVNVDGTQLHQLTPVRFVGDVHAVWSPDGSRIAFSGSFGGSSQLFLAVPGGGVPTDLGYGADPAYSPDGSLLIWSGHGGIDVAGPNGEVQRHLAGGIEPAWSPDGTRIAYAASDGVHAMDADGSNDMWLSPGSQPVWSPDGGTLLVSRETAGLHPGSPHDCGFSVDPDDVDECLGTVSAAGGDAHILAGSVFGLVAEPDQAPINAVWSADGASVYLSLQTWGTYQLPAGGGSWGDVVTSGVDPVVGVAQLVERTSLSLAALRPIIYWDRHDAFTGALTSPDHGIAAATVELQRRRLDGSGWVTIATTQTDSTGAYAFVLRLHFNAVYRVHFAAPFYTPATSRSVSVAVRSIISAGPIQPWRVQVGHYTRLSGVVQPSHTGHTVYLQLWRAGAWRPVASHVLGAPNTFGNSVFLFRIRGTAVGNWHYRVVIKADRLHAGNWAAAWLHVFAA